MKKLMMAAMAACTAAVLVSGCAKEEAAPAPAPAKEGAVQKAAQAVKKAGEAVAQET